MGLPRVLPSPAGVSSYSLQVVGGDSLLMVVSVEMEMDLPGAEGISYGALVVWSPVPVKCSSWLEPSACHAREGQAPCQKFPYMVLFFSL